MVINYKLISIVFLLCVIFFGAGATYGASKIAMKMMNIATDVLDIQLSEQAKMVLINKPELMQYAIKNYKNVTNPFILSNERLHFEECVLKSGDEVTCYNGMLAKYGNQTR